MKRLLCLFVLLLVVGSLYAPLFALGKPVDSKTVDAATGVSTLSKWGGVASLRVKPTDAVTLVNGKLRTAQNIEIRVDEHPDAVEYSWILASRPMMNVFSLELTLTGCTYYYQPPLDAGTYPAGWTVNATHVYDDKGKLREHRPIDVVGSYAVYSELKNGIYGTGKVAHIYRPLVTDARGDSIWGIMVIEGDTLTVTVDQGWLDKAKYPVVVDPTFGSTTAGASTTNDPGNWLYGTQVTSPVAANIRISKFTAYVKLNADGSCQFKAGVWVNSNGGAIIGVTSAGSSVSTVYAWRDTSYAIPLTINPSTVYMIAILPAYQSPALLIAYDTGTGGTGHRDTANSFTTPEVFDWNVNNDHIMSLYATYTSAPTITSSVIAMDDTSNVYTMKQYYTFTTVINDPDGAADIKAISVRGMQGATVRWLVNATSLDGVASYAIITGAATIDLDTASCTFTENGNDGTLVLKIRLEWDSTTEVDCELAVWARDVIGNTVGWTTVQTDYFDVISRLVTRDYTGNVTSTTINMPVEIVGRVRYATTPTGNNASASYPPDAQFTAVKLYEGGGDYAGSDATIVNGLYNVTVTTPAILGTVYYYAWLDLVPDYVDGYAVDADYVAIGVAASFSVISQVNEGFTFFGLTGAVIGQIIPTITALAVWFSDSATAVVNMASATLSLIIFVSTSVIYWFTKMATLIIGIFTIIGDILKGTGSVNTFFGDVWTYFSFSSWVDFLPITAFIWWYSNLSRRSKREGISEVERIIRDVQLVSYAVGEVWNWTFTLFNFVVNSVMTFVSVVTG